MTTLLGCIADDFTGATDLASMLARSGVKVSLRIGVPKEPPKDTSAFEVIALKSRTMPVSEAVKETRAALSWLQGAGAKRFFWKYCSTFDSTSKGNIGPVAEALMSDLKTNQTIYCPAFPENGRSVFMGNLFVEQKPLSESSMKDHPLTPMRDSNLMRLLEPQVSQPVGLIDRLTVAKGSNALTTELEVIKDKGIAHIVIDAVANSDLEVIATSCMDMPLITGGSALAMPLPELYMSVGLLPSEAVIQEKHKFGARSIILSGSCSVMTNKQVANVIKAGAISFCLDPLELAESGPQRALRWLEKQDFLAPVIIYATANPASVKSAQNKLGVANAGEIVEQALAACALVAQSVGVRNFVIAGGETSGAITKALGVTKLDIGPEIAPGVPWTFSYSKGNEIALSLKSGNFGDETFFRQALKVLEV